MLKKHTHIQYIFGASVKLTRLQNVTERTNKYNNIFSNKYYYKIINTTIIIKINILSKSYYTITYSYLSTFLRSFFYIIFNSCLHFKNKNDRLKINNKYESWEL